MIKSSMIAAVYAPADESGSAVTDTPDTPAVAEAKKRKVSDRVILDGDMKPQDDWADAKGFSYKSLAEDYELMVMFEELPDEIQRGLMAFGGLTLAGNVTNTVRNGENKGGAATEKEALIAWIDNLKAGNWTSPRGEVEAGLGALAEAYARAMAKIGKEITAEVALEKLKAADKDKRAAVRKDPQVKAELTQIIAERAAAKAKDQAGELIEL